MSKELFFSFDKYARALAAVVNTNPQDHAFVIGLTGAWGSGKTTLLNAVLSELGEDDFLPITFNAWAFSKQDSIRRALFVHIVSALRADVEHRFPEQEGHSSEREDLLSMLDEAERALYTAFTRETPGEIQLDAGQLVKSGTKLALRFVPWGDVGSGLVSWLLDRDSDTGRQARKESDTPQLNEKDVDQLWGIFKRDIARQYVAQTRSLEQFQNSIKEVLRQAFKGKRRLLVAIDDVDRCLPEQGLEIFEAIKLYLDLPGNIFLVTMDQDVLQQALDLRYRQDGTSPRRITSELYAEKMLDLTFAIPSYHQAGLPEFAKSLPLGSELTEGRELPPPGKTAMDILTPSPMGGVMPIAWTVRFAELALHATPRNWERFANRLVLYRNILSEVAKGRDLQDPWEDPLAKYTFIKLQLLQFGWPAMTRILGTLDNLILLENGIKEIPDNQKAFDRELDRTGSNAEAIKYLSEAESLPNEVWSYLEDQRLFEFVATPPFFSTLSESVADGKGKVLLEMMFSLDLPTVDPRQTMTIDMSVLEAPAYDDSGWSDAVLSPTPPDKETQDDMADEYNSSTEGSTGP